MLIRVVERAPFPGGRYRADGPYSGEWFREEVLRPALESAAQGGDRVTVDLDGAPGYGSSFLDEAFGGLVRTGEFTRNQLERLLDIRSANPLYGPFRDLAMRYIARAKAVPSTSP